MACFGGVRSTGHSAADARTIWTGRKVFQQKLVWGENFHGGGKLAQISTNEVRLFLQPFPEEMQRPTTFFNTHPHLGISEGLYYLVNLQMMYFSTASCTLEYLVFY